MHGSAGKIGDSVTAAIAAGTFGLSFTDWVDFGLKVTIGILTIILLLLRIKAHLWPRSASSDAEA